jgi:hypothetical protein
MHPLKVKLAHAKARSREGATRTTSRENAQDSNQENFLENGLFRGLQNCQPVPLGIRGLR